ncbi:hypothetical protein GCM10010377_32210 [Streptomyces viridiviolaceus]|uniref:Uncharacterized protein n=1 Tax=Streptomyces viridiviolaceus TaxID=68282 RepID=A0ABW2E9P5_9ACTN|nr:hypothetical protein [Streptomyces viridiviolaceus]GHB38988.1 hypothetical protein GCM10010377_32210 [Streptomyces viridiviolaceus]
MIYKTFRGLPRDGGPTGAIWAQRVDHDTFADTLAVTAHLFQAEIPNGRVQRGRVQLGGQAAARRLGGRRKVIERTMS